MRSSPASSTRAPTATWPWSTRPATPSRCCSAPERLPRHSMRRSRNSWAGANPRGIAVGEFNGDGDPDLAVGNIGSDEVKVVSGATGVNFNPFATITTGSLDPTFLAAADIDGNGVTELAVGHASSNIISLHTASGGCFGAPVNSHREHGALRRRTAGRRRRRRPRAARYVPVGERRRGVRAKGAPGASFGSRVNIPVGDGAVSPVGFTQPAEWRKAGGARLRPQQRGRHRGRVPDQRLSPRLGSGTLDSVEVGKISTAAQRVTFTNDGFGDVTPTSIRMTATRTTSSSRRTGAWA